MKHTHVFLLVLSMFIGACSQQDASTHRRVIYTLPSSYIGTILIINSPQEMESQAFREHKIPASGVLIVKKPINEGWDDEGIIEFFYRNNGKLEEITGWAARTPKDTPESRADPEIRVFGASVGTYESIHSDCKILTRSYYIGTNTDAYESVNFFEIDDYVKNHAIDCTGLEPGTLRKQHLATQEKREKEDESSSSEDPQQGKN